MMKMFVSHPNNTWDLVNIKLCDSKTHGRATMVNMLKCQGILPWNFVNMKLCDTKTNQGYHRENNNTWDFVNIKLCDTKTHGRATIDENVCSSS